MKVSSLSALAILAPSVARAAVNYTLSTTDFNRTRWQAQPYVANGYIGARLPLEGHGYMEVTPLGPGNETNGWPLFNNRITASVVAGFYNQQPETTGTNFPEVQAVNGEEVISLLPTWTSLYVTINGESYGVGTPDDQILNWTQSMSINDGIVSTSLAWSPAGSNSTVMLNYTVLAHRTRPNLGVVRLDVSGPGLMEGMDISFTNVLDGAGALRTDPVGQGAVDNSTDTIYSAVSPLGYPNITAYEIARLTAADGSALAPAIGMNSSMNSTMGTSNTSSNGTASSCIGSFLTANVSTAAMCHTVTAPANGTLSVIKWVGIASTDAFPGVELTTALNATQTAVEDGWDAVVAEHREAWNALWDSADVIIPGDDFEQLQTAARASIFHILSQLRNGSEPMGLGDNSLAPAGLTSDSYAGLVFWDADIWVAPGLLLLHPDYAESIVDYRWKIYNQSMENAAQYNRSGVLYAWTSGRTGKCTGTGPCSDYEYHLNSDIALAIYDQYAANQNRTWLEEKGFPIMQSVCEFIASFVEYNETRGTYDTFNMTSADEFSNQKNNSAFTNGGFSVVLKRTIELAEILNVTVPSNWSEIANNMTVLSDPTSNIILEFEGYNATVEVKQADVVLLTYPFEYEQSPTQALTDLDFYATKTAANGPGMTYSIYSIDASQLSPIGCAAYTYLLAASQPYNRAPFYQFSEQTVDIFNVGGFNPAFTFVTGHGGFLQALTHGYTGYRSRVDRIFLDPSLPPQLTNYTVKGMKWGGSTFDLTLTTENTTIVRTSGVENITIEISSRNARPGNFSLGEGETLSVPTRSTNGTLVEGNFAQCTRAMSSDTNFTSLPWEQTVVPGQFALAAIDGSNSTTWQPNSNASATLSVDLLEARNLSAFHINWGENPAMTFTIAAGEDMQNMTTLVEGQSVNISSPFDPATAAIVRVPVGNLTDVALNSTINARYVNFTIEGSQFMDGTGATVAEFAAIG